MKLKIISFNLRYDKPDRGNNAWTVRRDAVAATVKQAEPDLIGSPRRPGPPTARSADWGNSLPPWSAGVELQLPQGKKSRSSIPTGTIKVPGPGNSAPNRSTPDWVVWRQRTLGSQGRCNWLTAGHRMGKSADKPTILQARVSLLSIQFIMTVALSCLQRRWKPDSGKGFCLPIAFR